MGFIDEYHALHGLTKPKKKKQQATPVFPLKDPSQLEKGGVDNEKTSRVKKQKAPEKLNFLRPCPICEGRKFTCSITGGFFCIKCQPKQEGVYVIAGGHERPKNNPQKNTILKKYGNANTEHSSNDLEQAKRSRKRNKRQGGEYAFFEISLPWICKHQAELLAAGWSKPSLYRRAKTTWPTGPWGLAWRSCWSWPRLKAKILNDGSVAFSYQGPHGKITQVAHIEQA